MFTKGHKHAKGGTREGAGRKPDWLKDKCSELVERKKIIEFLADVASGEKVSRILTVAGTSIPVSADLKDRIKASEILLERGFGKSIQPVMQSDDKGQWQPYS